MNSQLSTLNSQLLAKEIRPATMAHMHGFIFLRVKPLPLLTNDPPQPHKGMRTLICVWSIRPKGPNPEIVALTHHGLN